MFFVLARKRQRLLHSAEYVVFIGLVGMDLQTEIADSDAVQTLFHDVERGFLFCDEQDAFPACESVCDNIGDGLRFSRSGRAVKHKTRAGTRERNGGILRTVRRKRQQRFFGIAVVLFDGRGKFLFLQTVIEQRSDDAVLFEFRDVVFDLVPHEETLERISRKIDVRHHVPSLHVCRFRAHHGKDFFDFERRYVAA